MRRTLDEAFSKNPNKFRMSLPRGDFIFLNRVQWGLFSVLATLGATANWRQMFMPLLYGPGEKWPRALG